MATTKPFGIQIEGVEQYLFSLDRFGELVEFLGPQTWHDVASVFYEEEERIFDNEGRPEKFVPLSPQYAARKAKQYPGMPIMQKTQALKEALTGTGATPGKAVPIKKIVSARGKQGVTLGVRSRYGRAHQFGLGHLPQRKIIQTTAAEKLKFVKVLQAALVRVEREAWGGIR